MKDQILKLEKPSQRYQTQFLKMVDEYRQENPHRFEKVLTLIQEDFEAYISYLDDLSKGIRLRPNYTQQISYWLIMNDAFLIGSSFLRPAPPEKLKLEEGHVRYDIMPEHREKGYATTLLHLTLGKARVLGLKEVILTCRAGSEGSVKTIMNNGGKYIGEFLHHKWHEQYFRYSITL